MQLEAIYDRGKLSFIQPVKLRNDHVRLVVNLPDDELVLPPQFIKAAAISCAIAGYNRTNSSSVIEEIFPSYFTI